MVVFLTFVDVNLLTVSLVDNILDPVIIGRLPVDTTVLPVGNDCSITGDVMDVCDSIGEVKAGCGTTEEVIGGITSWFIDI